MEHVNTYKVAALAILGAIGAFFSALFGGWDSALTTLVIFMVIDYVSGLIVAGIFKKSGKSESGALESRAGWKGLIKKLMTLIVILVAARLEIEVGTAFIKDTVVIGFIINETLSITENAGLMGVPMPSIFNKAIEMLKNKSGENEVLKE